MDASHFPSSLLAIPPRLDSCIITWIGAFLTYIFRSFGDSAFTYKLSIQPRQWGNISATNITPTITPIRRISLSV